MGTCWLPLPKSWLRKSEQADKWIFCLTVARIVAYQERQ
jgi:hypothetical protein